MGVIHNPNHRTSTRISTTNFYKYLYLDFSLGGAFDGLCMDLVTIGLLRKTYSGTPFLYISSSL
jgi:hypothetical protein